MVGVVVEVEVGVVVEVVVGVEVWLMTPLKISELPSHVFWKCKLCFGDKGWRYGDRNYDGSRPKCSTCGGTGKEPVEVENPLYDCGDKNCKLKHPNYKYQVGVEFEVDKECDGCGLTHQKCLDSPKTGHIKCCPDCNDKRLKFFPLYPKVKGDNSIMMVVPL